MAFERISEEELAAVGVELLDDQPGLAPDAMKAKFEETAKELLAPKYNKLADQMESETASESLGAKVPEGLPEETEKTVQAVLLALMLYVQAHEKNRENPHVVTAEQVGAYSKEQTDKAINDKVVAIGAGDMAMSVYDPDMLRKPIYPAIEEAVQNVENVIYKAIAANSPRYMAIYTLDGWGEADAEAMVNGYAYKQEVTLSALDDNAPKVTAASEFLPQMGTPKTGIAATDELLRVALNIISAGVTTAGAGTVTTLVREKPTTDIPVVWTLRTEV